MNCKTCRIEIEEALTGESLSREARLHTAACPACRAFHAERQALKKLVGSLEPVSAPADFDFRLRARLAASKAARGNGFSLRSFLSAAPALGFAAAFALLVGAVVFYNQMKTTTTNSTSGEIARESSVQKTEEGSDSPNFTRTATPPPPPAPAASPVDNEKRSQIVVASADNPGQKAIRGIKPTQRRNQPQQVTANSSNSFSNEFGRRSAPVITPNGSSPFAQDGSAVVQLPVRSASQRMRVLLDDRSGERRSINLEPVVFGSQDVAGRADARVLTAHGIW